MNKRFLDSLNSLKSATINFKESVNYCSLYSTQQELLDNFIINDIKIEIKLSIRSLEDLIIKLHSICVLLLNPENSENITNIYNNCYLTFQLKNADYGNSFVDFGLIGIIVRINDKINRLKKITVTTPNIINEKIEDTLMDLINYTIISHLIINE